MTDKKTETKEAPAGPEAEIVKASEAPATALATREEVDGEYTEGAITPFEGDYMEVTIEVAQHLEKFEKALDAIMNFIIKRCYAGDFVSHDRANTPPEDRTVNIIGAAAERIARDLGIQESNRTKPVKKWHDKEKHPGHYYYECSGRFSFRGRTVDAMGVASTLNPFYSKKHDNMVDPKDIREEYIVRDSYRDCVKQGVKGLFGLRKIPLMKLKELGYDISKVKYVNFQQGDKSAAAKNPNATAAPASEKAKVELSTVTTTFKSHVERPTGCQRFVDDKGLEFSLWRPANHEDSQRLLTAITNAEQVTLDIKYDGKYRQIQKVVEVVSQ